MPSQRCAGVVLGYANIVVKNLVNLVYTPMLLSIVGQADYGVYQTSNSFVFSLSLLSFGFSQAYVRFYTLKRAHGEGVRGLNGVYLVLYTVVSVIAFLLGLAFAASAGTLFSASFTPDEVGLATVVMSIMAGSIAVTLFNSVFDAYILAHEEFRFQQSRQMLTTLATPSCAYALLCLGFGIVGVTIVQLAVNLVLLALNASFCLGRLEMRFDVRHFGGKFFKAIAVFNAWIFASQVCELVNQNIPNIPLGAVSGAVAVSAFTVSVQIRSIVYSLTATMSNVFTPLINRIVAESDDNAGFIRLMARVSRHQVVFYLWVLGGFAVLGRFFMRARTGPGFSDVYWLMLAMVTPLFIPLAEHGHRDPKGEEHALRTQRLLPNHGRFEHCGNGCLRPGDRLLGAGAGLHRLRYSRHRSLHELVLPAARRARYGLALVPCAARRRGGNRPRRSGGRPSRTGQEGSSGGSPQPSN